jgi:hypothetical protein
VARNVALFTVFALLQNRRYFAVHQHASGPAEDIDHFLPVRVTVRWPDLVARREADPILRMLRSRAEPRRL